MKATYCRMKRQVGKPAIFLCSAFFLVFLFSCSSPETETGKKETPSSDTILKGRAGKIDKAPPVRDGDYTEKYPNGIIKVRGYYLNGIREGEWLVFFPDGKLQSRGHYKKGLREGKALVYHSNGNLYYEGWYKDGKESGKWLFYDESGKKFEERDYNQSLQQ